MIIFKFLIHKFLIQSFNSMKKITFLFFLMCFSLKKKKKYTVAQVEKSDDPKIIAAFLKDNPNHPRSDEFKMKMVTLIRKDYNIEDSSPSKPSSNYNKSSKKYSSTGVSDKNKQTAKVLNGMFNNDPNKKEALVQIINQSKCNLTVKFTGEDFYQLEVKASNQNAILIKKGNYNVSSSICDASYSSAKKIYNDISISLNAK